MSDPTCSDDRAACVSSCVTAYGKKSACHDLAVTYLTCVGKTPGAIACSGGRYQPTSAGCIGDKATLDDCVTTSARVDAGTDVDASSGGCVRFPEADTICSGTDPGGNKYKGES